MKTRLVDALPLKIPSRKEWEGSLQLRDLSLEIGRIVSAYELDAQLKMSVEMMTAVEAEEGVVRLEEIVEQIVDVEADFRDLKRTLSKLAVHIRKFAENRVRSRKKTPRNKGD